MVAAGWPFLAPAVLPPTVVSVLLTVMTQGPSEAVEPSQEVTRATIKLWNELRPDSTDQVSERASAGSVHAAQKAN